MESDRFLRIAEIFAQARELAGSAREAYLDEACADHSMRPEVVDLLRLDAAPDDDPHTRPLVRPLLEGLDDDVGPAAVTLESTLRSVAGFRILGICGSGGMGIVYEAEQENPRRRVALKVIRAGTMARALLGRFRREAEILARLQHPGIAQIFESGEFELDGEVQPYIAMEYVDGQSLLKFASHRTLTVSARIELFIKVCEAIHHAHDQGVVHRDVKPDNILVREQGPSGNVTSEFVGMPKVLDFGIAQWAESKSRQTLATAPGALLGSVAYMSPEQASGAVGEVEARSDLYSLGVILFELLTGKLPYGIHHMPLADALHAIRYSDPQRIGTADPGLRGDLDTIVGKCLEKEKDRRYDSVLGLVDDLRRFQEQKPIAARAPSTWYQLERFARRNRALVAGVLATTLALLVGAIVAVIFALESKESARGAQLSQIQAEQEAYRANVAAVSALLDVDPAHARRLLGKIPEERRGWEWRHLFAALPGAVLEFGRVTLPESGRFQSESTANMQLMAGGAEVVALSAPDVFSRWETRTGRRLSSFAAPAKVLCFAAGREGHLIAAALEDGRVVTADPAGGQPEWTTWSEGPSRVDAIAVAKAGDQIAIERGNELRFGRPGAWHVVPITGDHSSYFRPAELEFSPDGRRVAALVGDLVTYDTTTGAMIGKPIPSDQLHWSLAFSPGGGVIAAGQMRREVRVFDPVTGDYGVELLGHTQMVDHVAYGSPEQLLSLDQGGTIRVWNTSDETQIAVFDAPGTTRAEFLDERHVLTLTNGRFQLWTTEAGRSRELVGHRAHVFDAVFSGDGRLLATCAPWGDFVIWDPLESAPLRRVPSRLWSQFAFDPSGQNLLLSTRTWGAKTLERLNWVTGEAVTESVDVRGAFHRKSAAGDLVVDAALGPVDTGNWAAYRTSHVLGAAAGGTRAFRDGSELALDAPQALTRLGPHPLLSVGGMGPYEFSGAVAELIVFDGPLTPSGAAAVDAYLDQRRVGQSVEFPTRSLEGEPAIVARFSASPATVQCTPEGAVLAWRNMAGTNEALRPRGRPEGTISFVPGQPGRPAHVSFEGGYNGLGWLELDLSVVQGKDRMTVCWLGSYGTVGNEQTAYGIGSLATPFAGSDRDRRFHKAGSAISFSHDGTLVADTWSQNRGSALSVREIETGKSVAHFGGVYHGSSFRPNSTQIACGSEDGFIDIYDVQTGERVARVPGHSSACLDVAYSPDGTRMATCGNDNALRLWDAESLELLLEFPDHKSYVRGVVWSPDGTMLVSVSGDYIVRVWDTVPRDERYRQRQQNLTLEDEMREEVEALRQSFENPVEVMAEWNRRWPESGARRQAALKLLSRSL